MQQEKKRPKLVDKFLRVRAVRLRAKKWEDEHKAEMLKILKESTFDDVYISTRTSKQPNVAVMEKWCEENLPKELRSKMYVSVFDPNAFVELIIKSGYCTTKGIPHPKNIWTVSVSESVAERKSK